VALLTAPWFWIGLSIVAAAVSLAWLTSHGASTPIRTARVPGRSDTRRDHAEFKDDAYLR
jgi:hypothetical protein